MNSPTPEFAIVYQTETRTLKLRISDLDCIPLDLTGATEITLNFRAADGTFVVKKLTTAGVTILDAVRGRILTNFTSAETLALQLGERQDFEAIVDYGALTRRIAIFSRKLSVRKFGLAC